MVVGVLRHCHFVMAICDLCHSIVATIAGSVSWQIFANTLFMCDHWSAISACQPHISHSVIWLLIFLVCRSNSSVRVLLCLLFGRIRRLSILVTIGLLFCRIGMVLVFPVLADSALLLLYWRLSCFQIVRCRMLREILFGACLSVVASVCLLLLWRFCLTFLRILHAAKWSCSFLPPPPHF